MDILLTELGKFITNTLQIQMPLMNCECSRKIKFLLLEVHEQ